MLPTGYSVPTTEHLGWVIVDDLLCLGALVGWLRNVGRVAVLAAAPFAAFSIGSASAADLLVKAKPIVAATFDWSGVYLGAHAGYGGGMVDRPAPVNLVPTPFPVAYIAQGVLAGGQIGANKQLGSFVFGVELAGSWSDVGFSRFDPGRPDFSFTPVTERTSRIDGIATFSARAGLAADRWLVFAKAGVSVVQERHSLSQDLIFGGFLISSISGSGSAVRHGPMLGFGAEYAVNNNWSLFGEYNLHYFGERSVKFRGIAGGATPVVWDQRFGETIHVVKGGVNYRWGGNASSPSYPPVRPVAGNDWTGGYVGVQGGYGWGGKQWPNVTGSGPADYGTNGWLAGGTIGANAQSGSLVFGVEGEILGTGIKGSQTIVEPLPMFGNTTRFESSIDWLALATARAGFVVGRNALLYGKGGVAIAQEKFTVDNAAVLGFNYTASAKAIHTGVVVGAGLEYAIAPNWSVKGEYDYVRMFDQTVSYSYVGTWVLGNLTSEVAASKVRSDLHLVKFGVNYHFNPLPAVVAKY